MLRLLSILLVVIVVVSIGVFIFLTPMTSDLSTCYRKADDAAGELGFEEKTLAQNQQYICQQRFGILFELEECTAAVYEKYAYPRDLYIVAQQMYRVIQPWSKDLGTRKHEHNTECRDYPRLQVFYGRLIG